MLDAASELRSPEAKESDKWINGSIATLRLREEFSTKWPRISQEYLADLRDGPRRRCLGGDDDDRRRG